MRWYLDTEFNENGKTIELISLGLINEAGREFYACSAEINETRIAKANPWVGKNVLPKLPPHSATTIWMRRKKMAERIGKLLLPDPEIEVWAYFGAYDWVVFAQLWGTMFDLPKGMPMYVHDIKQEMDRLGIDVRQLPPQNKNSTHDAIDDARWNRAAHMALMKYEAKKR